MITMTTLEKHIISIALFGIVLMAGFLLWPLRGDAGHAPECGGGSCSIRASVGTNGNGRQAPTNSTVWGDAWTLQSYSGRFDMRLHCKTGPYNGRCANSSGSCSTGCFYGSGGNYHVRNNSYLSGHVDNSHYDSDGYWITIQDAVPPCTPSLNSVSLGATPASGYWPITVALTGTQTGPSCGGNTNWLFDCRDDGVFELGPYSSGNTNYSPPGGCTYNAAGTYTARARGWRNGTVREATTTITISDPPPPDVSVTGHNFCTGGVTGNITFNYTSYYIPAAPQTDYQVQVSDAVGFASSSVIFDSSKAPYFGGGSVSVPGIPPGKQLYARMKAWDNNSPQREGPWSTTYSFRTPPNVRFDMVPPNPVANASVSVTDTSNYGDAAPLAWAWDMGDGTTFNPGSSAESHIYGAAGGPWTVSLTVTDSFAQSCSTNQSVTIAEPIPIIKEVGPQ